MLKLIKVLFLSLFLLMLNGCHDKCGGSSPTANTHQLVALHLIPIQKSIAKGTSISLLSIAEYSDHTKANVTEKVVWSAETDTATQDVSNSATLSSDNSSIVGIDKGMAIGVNVGTANVNSSYQGLKSNTASLTVTAPKLVTLDLEPLDQRIAKGTKFQYQVVGIFSNDTKQDLTEQVTWISSKSDIASISNKGLATGLAIGETNVTASFNGVISNTTSLTVIASTLKKLTITPLSAEIAQGTTEQYHATGLYSDEHTQDLTNHVTWSTSNHKIANLKDKGEAVGSGIGTVTITANYDGITSNKAELTVDKSSLISNPLISLELSPAKASIPKGMTIAYKVIGKYKNGFTEDLTHQVSWELTHPTVSSIDKKAIATGDLVGTTRITASLDSLNSNSAKLMVTAATLQDIKVAPRRASIYQGSDQIYKATGIFSDSSKQIITDRVKWYSSDTNIASVDLLGLASGIHDGRTEVSAEYYGIKSNDVTLNVKPKVFNVVTWGFPLLGGDSAYVQDKLFNIKAIYSNYNAFAAIREDGVVITWGFGDLGGDSSAVQSELVRVKNVTGTFGAFAALRKDGSVVTWGSILYGGSSLFVHHDLNRIKKVVGNVGAFAAIRRDGNVVTWGRPIMGGDSFLVKNQLNHVKSISFTNEAFAALKSDGTVVTWGNVFYGGDSNAVQPLRKVSKIVGNKDAFAAITRSGGVITWGNTWDGGDSAAVQSQLTHVKTIVATGQAFAALLDNGKVVTWGYKSCGNVGGCAADSSNVQQQLVDVKSISSTKGAFAAILNNGKVVTWGGKEFGGDSDPVHKQLVDVVSIYGTAGAFVALTKDNKVVTWGNQDEGGYSVPVSGKLINVQSIASDNGAFAAIVQP